MNAKRDDCGIRIGGEVNLREVEMGINEGLELIVLDCRRSVRWIMI